MSTQRAPEISVVVPVYNESSILDEAVAQFLGALESLGRPFELILAQNGSRDATKVMVDAWAQRDPRVRALHLARPNYGAALRAGLLRAKAPLLICEEIDLCAPTFWVRALARIELHGLELVVGSKCMPGAKDERPHLRRAATRGYNLLLRGLVGHRGSDTHGLKVMQGPRMRALIQSCRTEHDVFASELVIRAQRGGLAFAEIPVSLRERRPPSVALHRRVPRVLTELWRLCWAIHGPKPGPARRA